MTEAKTADRIKRLDLEEPSDPPQNGETPENAAEDPSVGAQKSSRKYEKQCPRCGHRFYGEKVCPRCGYNGYFPMNERQIRRIKWILYPIALVAAGLAYYFLVVRSGS